MRLVNDQGIVGIQKAIALSFRQQDTVGHQFYVSLWSDMILKTDLVAHMLSWLATKFFSDPRCHCSRRDPAGLCVTNHTGHATAYLEANLG